MNRPPFLPILACALSAGACIINAAPAIGTSSSTPPLRRATLAFQDEPATKKMAPAKDAAEQREQIIRRLHGEFEDALSNLEKQNTGAATRDLQNKIVEDLNKLIDPPNNKNGPPPANQQDNPGAAKAANTGQGAKPNITPRAKSREPHPAPSSTKEKASGNPNNAEQKDTPGKLGKGEWGKLPPHVEQALDAYANDRFMRSYEELLRQYYRGIAEEKLRRAAD